MVEQKGKIKVLFVVILCITIGLVLGGIVGGYAAWKNKKAKEKSEEPLQAEKTFDQKSKEQKNKGIKEQAAKPVEIKDWQIYENKTYNYKIKYPKRWFVKGGDKDTPWVVSLSNYEIRETDEESNLNPGVKIEILVQGNPKNLNLKDWVEEGHQFSGLPKLTREMKISNLDAVWEELDFLGPTVNVTIMRANDVFTVSYAANSPDYENYMNVFTQMIKSMEIGGTK